MSSVAPSTPWWLPHGCGRPGGLGMAWRTYSKTDKWKGTVRRPRPGSIQPIGSEAWHSVCIPHSSCSIPPPCLLPWTVAPCPEAAWWRPVAWRPCCVCVCVCVRVCVSLAVWLGTAATGAWKPHPTCDWGTDPFSVCGLAVYDSCKEK
jgi:hypothetical protein